MTTMDSTPHDVVALIDEAIADATTETCEFCENRMPSTAGSMYFCGEYCQELWHARRAITFGCRRSAGAVGGDGVRFTSWEQVTVEVARAIEPRPRLDEVSAEALGSSWIDLVRRRWIDQAVRAWDIPAAAIEPRSDAAGAFAAAGENMRRIVDQLTPGVRAAMGALDELMTRLSHDARVALGLPEDAAAQYDVQHEGSGSTPMQRAIRAKRHRNTGPERRERKDRHRRVRGSGEWFQV